MKRLVDILMKAGTPELAGKNWGYLPYFLTLLANAIWPLGWIYCNENKISFAESTMMRGICTLTASYICCQYSGSPTILQFKDNLQLLTIRSLCMTSHSLCVGLAHFILPIPIVHTISCSGTLFVFILDYYINGTSINSRQATGIVFGLLGVSLVSNGNLLTQWVDPQYQYKSAFQNYLVTDPLLVSGFTLIYVFVTVLWAYGIILTRMAKANTFQINFMLGIACYFVGALFLPFMEDLGYQLSSFQTTFKVFLFTAVPCYVVQILVITALTMTKQTGVLNLASFTMVFVGYFISIFRYHETPNLICLMGIVLIIFGCTKTILFTQNK